MGKEIISDKEDHEDPVVDGKFQIKRERQVGCIELDGEVLAKASDVEEDEGFRVDGFRFFYDLRFKIDDFLLSCEASTSQSCSE